MKLKDVRHVFFRGLVAVLPIAVTIYVVVWLVRGIESIFSPILARLLPEGLYFPGMGVVVGLGGIFLVGVLLQALLARKVWDLGELLLSRMPLVSQVYDALKQVISYLGDTEQPRGGAVVTVTLGDSGTRVLGLVTQENLGFLAEPAAAGTVAVFLPWSYQVGGFTILVPRDAVEPVQLTTQEAFRFCLTAGIKKDAA